MVDPGDGVLLESFREQKECYKFLCFTNRVKMLNTSKDKLGKSRTISIPEWFSNLQLEYLTYKLREEMYEMCLKSLVPT